MSNNQNNTPADTSALSMGKALIPDGADFLWTYRTFREDYPFAVGTRVGGVFDNGGHALFATLEGLETYVQGWTARHGSYVIRGLAA